MRAHVDVEFIRCHPCMARDKDCYACAHNRAAIARSNQSTRIAVGVARYNRFLLYVAAAVAFVAMVIGGAGGFCREHSVLQTALRQSRQREVKATCECTCPALKNTWTGDASIGKEVGLTVGTVPTEEPSSMSLFKFGVSSLEP